MITHSESIKAISQALLNFQGAVDGVGKDGNNLHFKSRYATLKNVRDAAVPELQKVGLVYIQTPGPIVEGCMSFTTMLVHPESGEWMKLTGDIPLGKKDPQGAGSAITYMSRYSLMAALGLPAVDDDGEMATRDIREPEKRQTHKEKTGQTVQETREPWKEMSDALRECQSIEDLFTLWSGPAFKAEYAKLPDGWKDEITALKDALKDELAAQS